jgi:hypothetical protein
VREAVHSIAFSAYAQESECVNMELCDFSPRNLPAESSGRMLLSKGFRLIVQLLLIHVIPIWVKRSFALQWSHPSNDRSVNAASSFSSSDLDFHDGFVAARDIAQFVRANRVTKVLPAKGQVLLSRQSADGVWLRVFRCCVPKSNHCLIITLRPRYENDS